MTQILDHNGFPINTGLLKAEIASATPWGVRKATSTVSLTGLDPARLASLLRAAEQTDARPYLELAEEMEEKYLHYAAQLATRKRAVCGLEWRIDPASEKLRDRKIAEFVALALPALRAAAFDLLDALGKGYAVGEIIWDTSGAQWLPTRIERRDPRWFQYDPVDGRTLRLRSDSEPAGNILAPGKFIVASLAAKSGLPIRGGLARAASWAFLFHNFSLRDWATFCEMFGIPLRLGRYEVGAQPADLDILFQAVRDIGTDAAAMIPKGMDIDFPTVPAGRAGADLWEKLLDYLDRQVSKLVLGQTLTADTGKGGGGSFALGNVHNDVRTDILRADASALADTINAQLIKVLVDLNFAGVSDYPKLVLPVDEPEDMVALAGIVEKAVNIGQPVGQKWFAAKFGIPLPGDGEAVLGKSVAPAPLTAAGADPAAQRAAHARQHNADAIDDLVERSMADWQPALSPMLTPIQAAMSRAAEEGESAAQLIARLPQVIEAMDASALGERLGRAAFAARLAGEAGLGLDAEDGNHA